MLKKNPRILLSNDDGIHAPGIAILRKIAETISDDIWVVAPETEQSCSSHSLTLTRPLRPKQLQEKTFMVDGTPTDCVLLALEKIMPDTLPDLVLSGVNKGANMADDITYSGTVAAAMEAALMGIPSIALSQQAYPGHATKWETALAHGPTLLAHAIELAWEKGAFLNINFPDTEPQNVKGVSVTRHGTRPISQSFLEQKDPFGRTCYWLGPIYEQDPEHPDTDLYALSHGHISVTPIHLDLTYYPWQRRLSESLRKIKLK